MHFLSAFVLFFTVKSFSSTVDNKEVGNGGDVVVCRDSKSQISSIELLDYYEARELRQMQIDIAADDAQIPTTNGITSLVEKTLDRLATLNPNRVRNYKKYLSTFFEEVLFVRNKTLTDIPDSGHLFLPMGCQIEQIAIQMQPQYQQDPRYVINADLWSRLSLKDAAGLVLHEIIYREYILAGFNNSTPVRYFNSVMSSTFQSTLNLSSYIKLAAKIPLPDFDYQGLRFAICWPGESSGRFSPCNSIKEPDLKDGVLNSGYVVPPWTPWLEGDSQTWLWRDQKIEVFGYTQFEESEGKISLIETQPVSVTELKYQEVSIKVPGLNSDSGISANCHKDWSCGQWGDQNSIEFYPNGELRRIYIWYISEVQGREADGLLSRCNKIVEFHRNGKIARCHFEYSQEFHGSHYDILARGDIDFFDNEEIRAVLEIEQGRFFSKRLSLNKIRNYVVIEGLFSMMVDEDFDGNFFGQSYHFGRGFYTINTNDIIERFQSSVPVRLIEPVSHFPQGALVSAGYSDVGYLDAVDLVGDTLLHTKFGDKVFPSGARIYFDSNGLVSSCLMAADHKPCFVH